MAAAPVPAPPPSGPPPDPPPREVLRAWLLEHGVDDEFIDEVVGVCFENQIGSVESLRVAATANLLPQIFKPVVAAHIGQALLPEPDNSQHKFPSWMWRSSKVSDGAGLDKHPVIVQPLASAAPQVAAIPVDDLTSLMVAIYYVRKAFSSSAQRGCRECASSSREAYKWHAQAFLWLVLASGVCISEVLFLLSLGVANNWPRCTSLDDCLVGLACVRLEGVTQLQRALCNDCYYLVDTGGSPTSPWAHQRPDKLPGNVTAFCLAQLATPENDRFQAFPEAPSFTSCLYARARGEQMSMLDMLVLLLVFVLVAIEVSRDQKEQATAVLLRRHLLPWQRHAQGHGVRWAVHGSVLVWVCSIETLALRVVPALVPYATISLMLATRA